MSLAWPPHSHLVPAAGPSLMPGTPGLAAAPWLSLSPANTAGDSAAPSSFFSPKLRAGSTPAPAALLGLPAPSVLLPKCQVDGGTHHCQGLVVGLARRKTCSSQGLKNQHQLSIQSLSQARAGRECSKGRGHSWHTARAQTDRRADLTAGLVSPGLFRAGRCPGAVPMAPSNSHPAGSAWLWGLP